MSEIVPQYELVDTAIREYREAIDQYGRTNLPHSYWLHDLDLVVGQPRHGTDWTGIYERGIAKIEYWLRWRVLWRIPLA